MEDYFEEASKVETGFGELIKEFEEYLKHRSIKSFVEFITQFCNKYNVIKKTCEVELYFVSTPVTITYDFVGNMKISLLYFLYEKYAVFSLYKENEVIKQERINVENFVNLTDLF